MAAGHSPSGGDLKVKCVLLLRVAVVVGVVHKTCASSGPA